MFGSPASWKTAEFNRQWGLEAISAEFAYARGYTGKGVTIGVIDNAILSHPEFAGKLTRLDNGSYNMIRKTTCLSPTMYVAGIAAAKRDGTGMHGIAFDADIIGAKLGDYGNRNGREELIQSPARVINNSWGIAPAIRKDAKGKDIWLPNGRPDYVALIQGDEINKMMRNKSNVERSSEQPVPTGGHNSMAAMLRAARHGKLIVFSAGNYNNYNIPEAQKSLPYAFPDVLNNYLIVTNLSDENNLSVSSTSCGQTASLRFRAGFQYLQYCGPTGIQYPAAPLIAKPIIRANCRLIPATATNPVPQWPHRTLPVSPPY
nr:S8 family peptidase [Serratia marcescens]